MSKLLRNSKFLIRYSAVLLFCSGIAVADLPFPVGEELFYNVTWNGIPVAWSKATTRLEKLDGREVLALRVETRTFFFFDRFFKVDDFHESLVDPKTILPIRYTKNLKEGKYRCHEVTTFDFAEGKALYTHLINGTVKIYPIDADTRDLVSFMYFMRSELLAENSESNYRVMADEKVYDLVLSASAVTQVDLPHYDRKVPSLKMVPKTKFDGLFVRKGKAIVWVSRDPRRLLTFAKVKMPFGRVRITLHEVSGPGSDFWISEKKDGKKSNGE